MTDQPREARRRSTFITTRFEQWALPRIAARLPLWVVPDTLTGLGILAATMVAAGYMLSNRDPNWLWAVNFALVLHWLGDSLDGTLARVRKIERPRYGFYLDHLTDAYSTFAIGLGLGLSPYMLLSVGLAIVIAYYLLSINVYLETHVFGEFRFGYGVVGPTEARLALMLLNTLAFFSKELPFHVKGIGMTLLDVGGLAVVVGMVLMLMRRVLRNLGNLARLEPARRDGRGAAGGSGPGGGGVAGGGGGAGLLLALALGGAAIAGVGCASEETDDRPRGAVSPLDAFDRFQRAWYERDVNGFALLLADDYDFVLDSFTVQQVGFATATARQDSAAVARILGAFEVEDVRIDLRFDGATQTVTGPDGRNWERMEVRDVLLDIDVRPVGQDIVTFRVEDQTQVFFYRQGASSGDTLAGSSTRDRWFLVEWRDLGFFEAPGGGEAPRDAGSPAAPRPAVETTSWSAIKFILF
jgi:archaetidylinositol phosphate synthase